MGKSMSAYQFSLYVMDHSRTTKTQFRYDTSHKQRFMKACSPAKNLLRHPSKKEEKEKEKTPNLR